MGSKSRRGLSIGSSSSRYSRKYLGDANDPHFVPSSPLIERRKLSTRDEEELKHLCTLALANVPHSDDMSDDPFRYLASQITAKQPRATQQNVNKEQDRSRQQPQVSTGLISSGNDTATPSETSKRETLGTNDTTPMTTPGLTPAETAKRFSDVGKRPTTACHSHLRTEVTSNTKTFKANAVYSFLTEPLPATRPQTSASKSMTHLPTLAKYKSRSNAQDPSEQTPTAPLSNLNFNKSLPAIPKVPTSVNDTTLEDAPKEKARGLSRMLKTVRLQRTQTPPPIPERSTSSKDIRALQQMSENTSTKKHKFNFSSIFSKRNVANPKRATVG